jgi:hypothetical protein
VQRHSGMKEHDTIGNSITGWISNDIKNYFLDVVTVFIL